MRITSIRKKATALVLALMGSVTFQMALAQAVCTPVNGGPGAVLVGTASSTLLSVDTTTGKYTQIADLSAQAAAATGINAVANNPNNSLIYFVSNNAAAANRSIFYYNLATGVGGTLIADVTLAATGIILGTRGIASGAGFFDIASNS